MGFGEMTYSPEESYKPGFGVHFGALSEQYYHALDASKELRI